MGRINNNKINKNSVFFLFFDRKKLKINLLFDSKLCCGRWSYLPKFILTISLSLLTLVCLSKKAACANKITEELLIIPIDYSVNTSSFQTQPKILTQNSQSIPDRTIEAESSDIKTNLPINKLEIHGSTVLQTKIIELINSGQFYNLEDAAIVCSENSNSKKSPCPIVVLIESPGVSLTDLLNLRSAISKLYVDNSYITSGAFIPSNQILEDTVTIRVVEGELEAVEIQGLKRLSKNYILSRLRSANKKPLNQKRLLEAIQLFQLDSHIEQINGELIAGDSFGRNVLLLTIKEADPFNIGVVVANNRSPLIGSTIGTAFASYNNLLGFGDRISLEYGISEGLDDYGVSYSLPVNGMNGTLSFRYSNNDSSIITDDFASLNITSDSEIISLGFRQPIILKPQNEFALGLNLDVRSSQIFLDGDPLFFGINSTSDDESKSSTTVLRLIQEWSNRKQQSIVVVRNEFSLGLDASDAIINQDNIDEHFFSWKGQFQYAKRFDNNYVLLARLNTQLTPNSLLPLEQISIGGRETVRGYRANQSIADNGVVGSIELRIPLIENSWNQLQLTPFVDMGTVWNNNSMRDNFDSATLASIGTGLRWQVRESLNINVTYGLPLIAVEKQGNSLQDNGIYFFLRYQP